MDIDSVPCVEISAPVESVKIGGFLGDRLRKNVENRLLPFDIDGFLRMVEARNYTDWFWIGEQPGKWIEASIYAADYSGNKELRGKTEKALERFIAAQAEDGYLGMTSARVMTARQPFRGMDPYELYFSLHALLTAYECWGRDDALKAAEKLGGFFVAKVRPGGPEFWPLPNPVTIAGHSVHYGWEGSLLCDPMMRLYRTTGDRRYLEWVRWVVGSLDRWSNCDSFSKLDNVADGTLGIHEVQPYVHAHTFHMNFLGFLQLYQATGDKSCLRKVEGAWDDIVSRQRYITGGVSVGEHYEAGHNLPNTGHVVETCATMSWMLLCGKLLELTGDPKYADAVEMLLWNHLPAAQAVDGDGNRYHTPLIGWKPLGTFTGHDCCSASGPSILSVVPSFFFAKGDGAIYLNQYGPSEYAVEMSAGNTVTIRQVTSFPVDENVVIQILPEKPESFELKLRMPSWCERPRVVVDGKPLKGLVPGSYAGIRREWKNGDRVELAFPMKAGWIEGRHTNAGLYALARGPVVYNLDSVWLDEETRKALAEKATEEGPLEGLSGVVIDPDDPAAGLTEVDAPEGALGPAYEVRIVLADGKNAKALMAPFANLGTWYRTEDDKKDRHSRLFAYGVWLRPAPLTEESARNDTATADDTADHD